MIVSQVRFSSDRRYRYYLERRWDPAPVCCFVMLNPSTADELQDDPTVRRCLGFARAWGHGALAVVNLFALVSTNPLVLQHEPDPIGPENDRWILRAVTQSSRVVLAWGANGALLGRGAQVRELLRDHPDVYTLGTTASGQPRHPLYIPATAQLVPA